LRELVLCPSRRLGLEFRIGRELRIGFGIRVGLEDRFRLRDGVEVRLGHIMLAASLPRWVLRDDAQRMRWSHDVSRLRSGLLVRGQRVRARHHGFGHRSYGERHPPVRAYWQTLLMQL
jgi:hypothetical protein